MCVIIHLKPKCSIPDFNLENAVRNNPHGFGIIAATPKGLRVEHHVDPKNETEPDQVKKVLKKYFNYDRYLHLRYNTRGDTSLSNAHPFKVYETTKNNVWLMHNGTITGFGEITKGDSDTKAFVDEVVSPLVERLKFRNGFIDVNDPLLTMLIEKYVGGGNRVMLINSDNKPNFIGRWTEMVIKGQEEIEFLASNDTYFNEVVRGKHMPTTRHGVWRRGAGNTFHPRNQHNHNGIHYNGHNYNNNNNAWQYPNNYPDNQNRQGNLIEFTKEKNSYMQFYAIEEGLDNLADHKKALEPDSGYDIKPADLMDLLKCEKDDIWEPETFALLGYVGQDEFLKFVQGSEDNLKALLSTLCYMAFSFDSMCKQVSDLEEDKEKATKMIAELRGASNNNNNEEVVENAI